MLSNKTKLLAATLLLAVVLVTVGTGVVILRRGEKGAQRNELGQLQSAVTEMMLDNGIIRLPHPVGEPTQDMGSFPDFITSPEEKGMLEGDKPGYLLYGHDKVADGDADLTVNYIPFPGTRWAYTVDEDGTVR